MKFTILISLILGIFLSGCTELTTVVDEKVFTTIEELPSELQQDEGFVECVAKRENKDFQCATMSEDWNCQVGASFIFNKRKCVCRDHCSDGADCVMDFGAIWECHFCYNTC